MDKKIYKDKSAKDLFPALFEEINYEKSAEIKTPASPSTKHHILTPKLPRPSNKNWLRNGKFADKLTEGTQFKKALILSQNKKHLAIYNNIFKKLRYNIDLAKSESAAIEYISSILFSLVAYDNSLGFLDFEQYMRNLAGDKRRNLYYVIIGPELSTLYDLEALSLSANLVVNNKDVQYLDIILKKGFQDYETLYRPFIETLETNKESRYQ
jgi:hypothetical protein